MPATWKKLVLEGDCPGDALEATSQLIKTETDKITAVKAKTDLIPAIPMPATIPAQAFPFTNPATFLSLVNMRLLADCGPYALSEDVLFAHDAEVSINAQTYTKVKEINVGYFKGTIRTAFKLKAGTAGHWVVGRVYRNGVGLGSECGMDTTDYYEYKQDFEFAVNDLLQLYVLNSDVGYPMFVKDFRILGKFPIPVVPAITL